MNFTREPIIETIISPKEGFKLVLRNTKIAGQEEYCVDAVQVVTIGSSCFYRTLEKPKPFIVPALDFEVLEVREAKMAMKLPTAEKGGIKIGGGKPPQQPKSVPQEPREEVIEGEKSETAAGAPPERGERRRDRRRMRRQKDRFDKDSPETENGSEGRQQGEALPKEESFREEKPNLIIPPPSTLISETIARYKDIPSFASAFFDKDKEPVESEDEAPIFVEEETITTVSHATEDEDLL